MHSVEHLRFGEVEGWRLGYGPVGRPLMTVCCYLAGGVLVDTGQSHMGPRLLEALARRPPAAVALTHHHEDHSGNAARIAARYGVPVWGHALTAGKLAHPFPIQPYQHFVWGAARPTAVSVWAGPLEADGFTLTPIHTPGHSKDHTVYLDKANGRLYAGDLFIGERIKFFRADEDMGAQIASLKRVLQEDFDALFCAHNPRPTKGREALQAKLAFLEELRGQVARLHGQGLSERQIVRRLDPRKDRLVKLITLGNASCSQMIRSTLRTAL
jgi:glyoxylase-like metal-dependent hydrolase (beta-lactamase superfamily II)